MKVGLITYGLDRPLTGISRYIVELAGALANLNDRPEITLLQAGSSGSLEGWSFRKVPLPGCRLLPGLLTLGNFLIPRVARRLDLDVIHDPIGVAPFLFDLDGIKRVLTLHDVFPWSCPETSILLEKIIYRHWLPHIIRRVDAVITPSRHSQTEISIHLPGAVGRIHVLPYGVSAGFHLLPMEAVENHLDRRFGLSSPYILYAGALSARKNIARLLQAFSSVKGWIPDLRLVLVGQRTGKKTPVDSILRQEGLLDRVVLTGSVSDEDLAALYNRCLLFVFPSLYEGFGLPPLEAMACGAPVVCSNTSSLPEVVGEAALTVDPVDTQALANAMLKVLSDAELRKKMREKGLLQARKFSWERNALETMEVYRKVVYHGPE